MAAFRTVLSGTCLINGHHPPGSDLARECPVLKRQARQEQARKAAGARWAAPGTPDQHPDGS